MNTSLIRLFRAVLIETKTKKKENIPDILKETVKRGFIFSSEVIVNYSEKELMKLIGTIEKEVGLTPKQMNASFHKSWLKVANADISQLICEQIVHYITTYGFEASGIYNQDSVYIPSEKLEIPELKESKQLKLVVIHGYTKEEIKEKLLFLLGSGIAMKEETVKDVVAVCGLVKIGKKDLENIKNKEVRCVLYDKLNILPENNIEFLRLVVYKTIGKTLIIKNPITIMEIKNKLITDSKTTEQVADMFYNYVHNYKGYKKLAEIFNRFKPLFLAFRTKNSLARIIINKTSRLSKTYHVPMKEDYLNNVTSNIENIKIDELKQELGKVNQFRKIRLAYALNYRTTNPDSIMYKIRNGKSFATSFDTSKMNVKRTLNVVLESIVNNMNVKGKKIYIPEYIDYALPASEKQFVGFVPSGSCITVKKDLVLGVHWTNIDVHWTNIDNSSYSSEFCRVDLDLSLINVDEKMGWDGYYRKDGKVLFSGDMTDAPKPNGATELFYVKKQENNKYMVFVNYYNHSKNNVPFDIVIGQEEIKINKKIDQTTDWAWSTRNVKNFTMNPNNVLTTVKAQTGQEVQKTLGLLVVTPEESKFYFSESALGKSITVSKKEYVKHALSYMFKYHENSILLKEVIEMAGGKIVRSKTGCDIDLSPENLEKDTILKLVSPKAP